MEDPQQEQRSQQQHIDLLLERYLALLDTYASLRRQLSDLQSSIYQNIARANFAAERGTRYGQDYYDERMRALRTLEIQVGQDGVPIFRIEDVAAPHGHEDEDEETKVHASREDPEDGANIDEQQERSEAEAEQERQTKRPVDKDPLRWFGLFTPAALRTAQGHSSRAVGDVIPRLLSVSAEMADVEIQVRRARKRRAKSMLAMEKQAPGSSEAISSTV